MVIKYWCDNVFFVVHLCGQPVRELLRILPSLAPASSFSCYSFFIVLNCFLHRNSVGNGVRVQRKAAVKLVSCTSRARSLHNPHAASCFCFSVDAVAFAGIAGNAGTGCLWLTGTFISKVSCVQLQDSPNKIHSPGIRMVLGEAWAKNPWRSCENKKTFSKCVLWRWINTRKGSARVGRILNAARRFCFETLTTRRSDFKVSWRLICECVCWVSEGRGRHFEKWPSQATVLHSCKSSHSAHIGCESASNCYSRTLQESWAFFLFGETKIVRTCRFTLLANLGKALEL